MEAHLKGDLVRGPCSIDTARLLPQSGLIPTGALPVVRAHIEITVDRDRPDPGGGAIRGSILTERRDTQIVGFRDLSQRLL